MLSIIDIAKSLEINFCPGGSRTINERGGGHWWAWTWKQSEFLMICGPVGGGDGSVVVVVVVVVVVGGDGCL